MRKSDKWIGLIIGLMLGGTVLIGSGIVQNVMNTLGDTIYGGVNGASTRLPGNTSTGIRFLAQTGDGVNSAAPSWQIAPAAGFLTYYLTNTASSVATYLQMTTPPYTPKTTLSFAGLATGTDLLKNWATNAGTPNLTFIPAGEYEFHIHADRTGGGNVGLFAQIWEVSATGVDIAMIGVTETTANLTGVEVEYRVLFVDPNVYTFVSPASRVVARVFAIVSGSAPTVNLFVGDEADSHLSLPSNTIDASNFVPYTGATQNVDLGAHSITVASCTGCGGGGGGTPGSTLFSATANAGPNDSAAETSLIGAVVGSTTIPGATFTNGAVLEARSQGFYSLPAVADTLTLKAKCGTTVIGSASFTPAAGALTNGTYRFWLMITARGTGAGGAFSTNGIAQFTGSTLTGGPVTKILNASPVAFDFTSSCVFDMTAQWGGAQVGELMTGTEAAAWMPGAPVTSVNGMTGAVTIPAGYSNVLLSNSKTIGVKGSQVNGPTTLTHGSSLDLLSTVSGAGYVDHIWMANGAYDLEIKVYIDGSASPTIDITLPNLIGGTYSSFGSSQPAFASTYIGANSGGSNQEGGNFDLPIPFASSVKITVTNTNVSSSYTIYSMVSYQLGVPNTWPNTQKLFASVVENDTMAANSSLTMVDVSPGKKGRLAGFTWIEDSAAGSASPPAAPLEGEFNVYVDGSATPSWQSSGTEDAFNMGGYFFGFSAPSLTPEYGLTMKTTNLFGAYRFFIHDPILFTTGVKMTWNCGNTARASFTGTCKSQTTTFYYLEN